MEQSIDPNAQPVHATGTDPAFIPGLMTPRPAEAQENAPEPTPEDRAEMAPSGVPEDTVSEAAAEPPESEGTLSEGEEAADGPAFEAGDRRASISADRTGVRLTLDEEEAWFGWEEIGAVEISTPRFGRRFSVTVYTSSRRWYHGEVDAPDRRRLKEWEAELDAVLEVYVEEA